MDFKEAIRRGCLSAHLKADTKNTIIEEMIDMLCAAGRLPDREAALQVVFDREKKMSTGMQYGVAIPHGKTATVHELVVAIALKPEGVDFESTDGTPSYIFIMTLSPINDTGPHVQFLSEISKLLSQPVLRKSLLEARSEDEMIQLLLGI